MIKVLVMFAIGALSWGIGTFLYHFKGISINIGILWKYKYSPHYRRYCLGSNRNNLLYR